MQPHFYSRSYKIRASGRLQRCAEETCHAGMTRTSQQIRQGVFDNTADIRRTHVEQTYAIELTQYHQAFRQRYGQ